MGDFGIGWGWGICRKALKREGFGRRSLFATETRRNPFWLRIGVSRCALVMNAAPTQAKTWLEWATSRRYQAENTPKADALAGPGAPQKHLLVAGARERHRARRTAHADSHGSTGRPSGQRPESPLKKATLPRWQRLRAVRRCVEQACG